MSIDPEKTITPATVVNHQPVDDIPEVNAKNLDEQKKEQYDVAAGFLAELASRHDAAELMAPWTPEEEKRVKLKLDLIILPLVCLTNLMSAVDKVALGTAATFGLREDLHLTGSQYSWANSIVYFGCMIAVYPQLYLLQHYPIGRIFAMNAFLFAVMTFAVAGCKNAGGLLAVRFFLGIVEGFGTAGTGLIISMYWRRSEQGWRCAMVFNTFSSIVSGLLSYAVQFYTGGKLARWRLLFVICGAISIVVAVLDFFFLPATSTTAWWLTDRQKYIATQRVASNQTGIINHHTKFYQIKEALLDVKTWLIFTINVCFNIPNGGLIGFSALIVKGLGFSVKETTLLNIPNGFISWSSSLIWAFIATKTKKPLLCCGLSILVVLAGTIGLNEVPRTNKAGSLVLVYIMYQYWAPYVIIGTIFVWGNIAGSSKKSAVYGISYLGYCTGNLIGPQTFKAAEAPTYKTAIIAMLTFYVFSILLIATLGFVCWKANKDKVKQEEEWRRMNEGVDADVGEEWKDLTDKENPKFRYYW